jgi:cyanate permease
VLGDQYRRWSRAEAARTVPFWAVIVGFTIVLFCQVGFLAHEVAFLTDRYDSGTGARAIAVSAIGSAIARLIVGSFADAVDKRLLTMVLVLMQGATVAGFVAFDALPVNYLLALVFGFTMGNIFMFQALLVGEIFGIASFGSIFGLTSAVSQIAGGGGPVFIGWLESASGSYSLPFMITAVMTALASLVIAQARPLVTAGGAEPAAEPVPAPRTAAPAALPD